MTQATQYNIWPTAALSQTRVCKGFTLLALEIRVLS